VSEVEGAPGVFNQLSIVQHLNLSVSVIACNPVPSQHHPPVRFLSVAGHEGAVLCVRVHGRKSVPSYQNTQRSFTRRRTCVLHLSSDCGRFGSHSRLRVLSSRHEAGERVGHDDRVFRLRHRITHCAAKCPKRERRRSYNQTRRFQSRPGNEEYTAAVHRVRLDSLVSRSRGFAPQS